MADTIQQLLGRERFAGFMDRWFKQSTLTRDEFCSAANAAVGSSRLHPPQLLKLCQGTAKQISIYTFEAIGSLASATYDYHHLKKEKYRGKVAEYMRMIPVITDHKGSRLDFEDIAKMYVGRTEYFPKFPEQWLGAEWSHRTDYGKIDLGKQIRLAFKEIDPKTEQIEMLRLFMDSYPSQDPALRERIEKVILKEYPLGPRELADELPLVTLVLSELDDTPWTLERLTLLSEMAIHI